MTPSQVRNSETSELFKPMHLARQRRRLIWNELISTLHSKLVGHLPIYGAWSAFVVFLLPSLNGFKLEKTLEGPLWSLQYMDKGTLNLSACLTASVVKVCKKFAGNVL